mmetsp:Transcript_6789/g.17613  ORF Transcript_6789/g.17613 Transcript_6789/m.17613 type:complete len:290 (-) Transcript_6789:162-1031(-)
MAGVALTVVTLVACALLLLLLHLELQSAAPVHLIGSNDPLEPDELPSPRPPPAPAPYVEPLCQVTFGRAVCMRGGVTVDCPAKVDQVRHDTKVTTSGAWELSPTYTYFLDRGIVRELTRIFASSSVIELGAGKGCYADALRRAPPIRMGAPQIAVRAFDGAPSVADLTGGLVQRADLSKELRVPPADWVLCLETAEHIPRPYEDNFIANLDRLNAVGIVLSWSNNAGGNGHVNLRTNEWVEEKMQTMGYKRQRQDERALRQAVSDIHWFRDTLMVFRRTGSRRNGRRGV